jgi:hypothetical protein
MDIGADSFLQSFLKECKRRGMHVLVAHVVPPEQAPVGGPAVPVHVMSTEDDDKTTGVWNWLTKTDARAIAAAARALFIATGHATPEDFEEKWKAAGEVAQQGFAQLARVAFDAARAHAGKSLGGKPAKPLVTS